MMSGEMGELDLGSMFLLGFLGTAHCIGMCGPLVLALPAASGRLAPQLTYQLGRVVTYTLVGGLAGGIGAGLIAAAAAGGDDPSALLERAKLALRLAAALFLVAFGLARLGVIPEPRWLTTARPDQVPWFGRAARGAAGGGTIAALLFGLAMGLLPCGLSYAAFARALAAGDPLDGALLVLAFGAGTIPGLALLGTVASGLARRHQRISNLASGVLMLAMAGWILYEAFALFNAA